MKKIIALLLFATLAFSCVKDPEVPKDIIISSITVSAFADDITTSTATISGTCPAISKMKYVKVYCGTDNPPRLPAAVSITGTSFSVTIKGLSAKTKYYYFAEAAGVEETFSSAVGSFTTASTYDLSASGTANCYIVSSDGSYSFNAKVIGNGPAGLLPDISQDVKKFHATTTDISPLSAKLLWQDEDGLISGVSLNSEGELLFTASSGKGNALVAVYDNVDPDASEAKILWSWHIWCTDTPVNENYLNWVDREFTLMDRNLGATSSLSGSAYGLHYQWGRKDPFSKNDAHLSVEAASSETGTISNTISHPTHYYFDTSEPNDWYYGSERNNYLWGNSEGYNYNTDYTAYKTVYDPCPQGYMVAPQDTWTGFTSTGGYTQNVSKFNISGTWSNGWNFYNSAQGSGTTSWYPAVGYRSYESGLLEELGGFGNYWSSSPDHDYDGIHLQFRESDTFPMADSKRASGYSVRCLLAGGEFISFTISLPLLGATTAAEVTTTTAKIGSEVTDLGDACVTERGVLYSTSANPTVSIGIKIIGAIPEGTNGKGAFSVDLTDLTPGTTYYYRAYAINAAGIGYSEEKSFTTASSGTFGGNEDIDTDDKHEW